MVFEVTQLRFKLHEWLLSEKIEQEVQFEY